MTIPHKKYGHLLDTYFRYLPCLLDRGHITFAATFSFFIRRNWSLRTPVLSFLVLLKSKEALILQAFSPLFWYNNTIKIRG